MITLEQKYKDRDPLKTVEIITDFFNKKGFQVKIESIEKTEADSWGCYTILFIDNRKVLQQCGKGRTKEYAIASGMAELFERFCCRIGLYMHPALSKKFIEFNYLKNNYHFSKDEKELSYNEILSTPGIDVWFDTLFRDQQDKELYLDIVCQNGAWGVPFIDYRTKEKHFYEPRVLQQMITSSGMAAGNTLEEALVQGMSEMFEHYTSGLTFQYPQEKYFYIKKENLNSDLQYMINKIESTGNEIKIYDLSYNFGTPVCMCVLTNVYDFNFHMDFGAAPIFDIAAERTITELYQNWETYTKSNTFPQAPFDAIPWYDSYAQAIGHIPRSFRIRDEILFKSVEVEDYNKEVFYDKNKEMSNELFLKYFDELCKKFNTTIHYYNTSPISEMYAVQIFCPNLKVKDFYLERYGRQISETGKKNAMLCLYNYYQFLLNIFSSRNINWDKETIEYYINLMKYNKENEFSNMEWFLMGSDWFSPYACPRSETIKSLQIALDDTIQIYEWPLKFENNYYKSICRKYVTIYNFVHSHLYTKDQIKEIFNKFNVFLNDTDIELIENKWYLIYLIFIKPYFYEFFSEQHNRYIQGCCD